MTFIRIRSVVDIALIIVLSVSQAFAEELKWKQDVCSFNCKADLSIPPTDVPIAMDRIFVPTHSGLEQGSYKGPPIEQNNVAFTNSVMTGTIDGEVVYRFQNKFGYNASKKQDIEDSLRYRQSRSEYKIKDRYFLKPNVVNRISYEFYIPSEIEFKGFRTLHLGQMKTMGQITWSINMLGASDSVGNFERRFRPSEYALRDTMPKDLVFQFGGVLDVRNADDVRVSVPLQKYGEWQGRWNRLEFISNFSDSGFVWVKFNEKTVLVCSNCDTLMNNLAYSDPWHVKQFGKDNYDLGFQFGVYQYANNPDDQEKLDQNLVNAIGFMKNIEVIPNWDEEIGAEKFEEFMSSLKLEEERQKELIQLAHQKQMEAQQAQAMEQDQASRERLAKIEATIAKDKQKQELRDLSISISKQLETAEQREKVELVKSLEQDYAYNNRTFELRPRIADVFERNATKPPKRFFKTDRFAGEVDLAINSSSGEYRLARLIRVQMRNRGTTKLLRISNDDKGRQTIKPLLRVHKSLEATCDKTSDNNLDFVIESTNSEAMEAQKCRDNFFANTEDGEAKRMYQAIKLAIPTITKILEKPELQNNN